MGIRKGHHHLQANPNLLFPTSARGAGYLQSYGWRLSRRQRFARLQTLGSKLCHAFRSLESQILGLVLRRGARVHTHTSSRSPRSQSISFVGPPSPPVRKATQRQVASPQRLQELSQGPSPWPIASPLTQQPRQPADHPRLISPVLSSLLRQPALGPMQCRTAGAPCKPQGLLAALAKARVPGTPLRCGARSIRANYQRSKRWHRPRHSSH